jgi:hypothetical protein
MQSENKFGEKVSTWLGYMAKKATPELISASIKALEKYYGIG